ncbi:MAG: OmpA family protein [Sulfurovaceae bacterium]|nr:OmpA family protein [Sulfurovaceae bacterium]
MKSKKLFIAVLIILISLLLSIWIFQENHLEFKDVEFDANKNKILYEPIPISIKKTISEAQQEISLLLIHNPIKFLDNSSLLEDNKTINDIVSILNKTVGDIAIKVTSHSDNNQTASYNRKLTQKRADTIASYIKNRYKTKFITAIGYGKEFPLYKDNNKTRSSRIEIYLRRINDF